MEEPGVPTAVVVAVAAALEATDLLYLGKALEEEPLQSHRSL